MGRTARMTLPAELEPGERIIEAVAGASRVLLVAWEYPGAHSRRGTALARRVGQLARGLSELGWSVTALHRLQREGDPAVSAVVEEAVIGAQAVRRRAIPGPPAESRLPRWLTPVRKVSTMWTAFSSGDRSGRWAANVHRVFDTLGIEQPDIVIAFFTPRGPLAVASALHRERGTPWIADFQDPWWEGTSRRLRPIVASWMRRTLRSATTVVQVSPEWAADDAAVLRRRVEVVRHAVPTSRGSEGDRVSQRRSGRFRILYVGSLNPDQQDIRPFIDALALVRREHEGDRPIEVEVAAGEESWRLFSGAAAARGIPDAARWLGWLDERALHQAMNDADCLLLIPMVPEHRRGVPSKLFEYLAYDTPVLIAGPDSGGMTSLLDEWAHPPVVAATAREIASALVRARDGDPSGLLQRRRCGRAPITDKALATWYSERMHRVLHEAHAS